MIDYPMNCPNCGGEELEHNGEAPESTDLIMLCLDCGCKWEPMDEEYAFEQQPI